LRCSIFVTFFFSRHGDHRDLHSFPTRRSSDLAGELLALTVSDLDFDRKTIRVNKSADDRTREVRQPKTKNSIATLPMPSALEPLDRKSTRLNSSHVAISYAVFCLKKKMPHLLE